jgi:hypothetical protein
MDEDQGILPQLSNRHGVEAHDRLESKSKNNQAEQALQALVKTDKQWQAQYHAACSWHLQYHRGEGNRAFPDEERCLFAFLRDVT